MYLWLVVLVAVIWLWLVGGTIYAYRRSYLNVFLALLTFIVASGAALVALLFIGPYWNVVYVTVLQPG